MILVILISMTESPRENLPNDNSPKKRKKRSIRFSESMDIVRDSLESGIGTDIVRESLERTLDSEDGQPVFVP